jgi:hypothetical protein
LLSLAVLGIPLLRFCSTSSFGLSTSNFDHKPESIQIL